MPGGRYREKAEELFATADVRINGDRPWDIQVHDDRAYTRWLADGSLGFGESYMDGWWDSPRLDELILRLIRARLDQHVRTLSMLWHAIGARLFNEQTRRRSRKVGRQHYDIGNRLYEIMLGDRMMYSCGYWRKADTLDEAQEAKLDLICRKLDVQPGMRVLDIGCGWGGAARFVAEKYGAEVVGVTISSEQAKLAEDNCKGLPVDIRLEDYRNIDGKFDRIYSIGMFEHVGFKNYRTYMKTTRRLLAEDGRFLLHTIGGNYSVHGTDPWVRKYIFPNSMLPSITQIGQSIERQFVMEDWHNFGPDYDRTLMSWWSRFDENWDKLKADYDQRFYRMWKFYLLSAAGLFRCRENQLWQIVLTPHGLPGGFPPVR
jgi:cyclopropane-fatty-acyl-phospholipid synthase